MGNRLKLVATALALVSGTASHAQVARTILPIPQPPFTGKIAAESGDATPAPTPPVRAPDGAPNVVMFMSDDTGFAMSSVFIPHVSIDLD